MAALLLSDLIADRNAMFNLFGISVAFVATKSGLLRWHDINSLNDQPSNSTG